MASVGVMPICAASSAKAGAVESASEIPLLIKTRAERYAALEATIRRLHPYEIPEIVALPVGLGLPDYLAWVALETGEEG